MSTDFRALCAELTDVLAELPFGTCEELLVRARAALVEPGPEDDVALLREALLATAAQRRAEDDARAALASPGSGLPQRPESFEFALDFLGRPENDELLAYVEQLEARAALAAESVAARPTLQLPEQAPNEHPPSSLDRREVAAWYHGHGCGWQAARAALAADGPAVPEGHFPAPPVAGEVGELVAWLRASALGTMEEGQPATSRSLTRAADLLEQRHREPVRVAEGLPELRGMFERILCVARSSGQRPVGNIELADRLIKAVVSWSALPLPAGEVGHG